MDHHRLPWKQEGLKLEIAEKIMTRGELSPQCDPFLSEMFM